MDGGEKGQRSNLMIYMKRRMSQEGHLGFHKHRYYGAGTSILEDILYVRTER